jgi:hypothetical protein
MDGLGSWQPFAIPCKGCKGRKAGARKIWVGWRDRGKEGGGVEREDDQGPMVEKPREEPRVQNGVESGKKQRGTVREEHSAAREKKFWLRYADMQARTPETQK